MLFALSWPGGSCFEWLAGKLLSAKPCRNTLCRMAIACFQPRSISTGVTQTPSTPQNNLLLHSSGQQSQHTTANTHL